MTGLMTALVVAALGSGGLGMYLLMPRGTTGGRIAGVSLCGSAMLLLWVIWGANLSPNTGFWKGSVFYLLGTVTVVGAFMTVTHHNPVSCALWFACTVIGTAGLFFLENAQFLAAAIVIVYAGAVIVMFLFVIMLAQQVQAAHHNGVSRDPERAVGFCFILLGILAFSVLEAYSEFQPDPKTARVSQTASLPESSEASQVAAIGSALFSEHWVSVEVAGTLLLVAMVGAIVISSVQRKSDPSTPDSVHLRKT